MKTCITNNICKKFTIYNNQIQEKIGKILVHTTDTNMSS